MILRNLLISYVCRVLVVFLCAVCVHSCPCAVSLNLLPQPSHPSSATTTLRQRTAWPTTLPPPTSRRRSSTPQVSDRVRNHTVASEHVGMYVCTGMLFKPRHHVEEEPKAFPAHQPLLDPPHMNIMHSHPARRWTLPEIAHLGA